MARRRRSSTLLIFAYFLIYNVLTASSNSLRDQLVIVISRDDVRAGRFEATLSNLNRLIESDENIRRYEERVEVTFHGYDTHPDEVFEIAEVRNFVYELDERFLHWLYFLTKEGTGLQALAFCFIPSPLTREAERKVWPDRLDKLLENRWMPALVMLCEEVGMEWGSIESRLMSARHYFVEGPRRAFDPGSA